MCKHIASCCLKVAQKQECEQLLYSDKILGMQIYRYIAIFITAIQYNTPNEEYRYIAHCNILRHIATFLLSKL